MDKTGFTNIRVTERALTAIRKLTQRTGEKQYRLIERVMVEVERGGRSKRKTGARTK